MPLELRPATPDAAGITAAHIRAIDAACKKKNVFLIVRPSEKETMTLIDTGFATKNMDIHDKSSNWGLTAGMVPSDAQFSKKKIGPPDLKPARKIHGRAHTIHLALKPEWVTLIGTHFPVTKAPFKPQLDEPGIVENYCLCGGTLRAFRHYRDRLDTNFCFLLDNLNRVSWRWANPALNKEIPVSGIPMFVWAYEVGGEDLPVTGDYDVWMLAPGVTNFGAGIMNIKSKPDAHGRSAATDFYTDFLDILNADCVRAKGGRVFHHGAEAQNFSFTQDLGSKPNSVFCPGTREPFMVDNKDLPRLIYEMLRHGYVATMNPKWRKGVTLGIEDTGYAMEDGSDVAVNSAAEQIRLAASASVERGGESRARGEGVLALPGDKLMRLAGMDVRNQAGSSAAGANPLALVETSAALALQRRFRNRKAPGNPKTMLAHLGHRTRWKHAEAMARTLREDKTPAAQAVKAINDRFFSGRNQGMSLLIYQGTNPKTDEIFTWGGAEGRVAKLQIFRKIAAATGLQTPPEGSEGFPEECFQPLDEARRLELLADTSLFSWYQEKQFGRTGFERADDGHGHVSITPIDEMV